MDGKKLGLVSSTLKFHFESDKFISNKTGEELCLVGLLEDSKQAYSLKGIYAELTSEFIDGKKKTFESLKNMISMLEISNEEKQTILENFDLLFINLIQDGIVEIHDNVSANLIKKMDLTDDSNFREHAGKVLLAAISLGGVEANAHSYSTGLCDPSLMLGSSCVDGHLHTISYTGGGGGTTGGLPSRCYPDPWGKWIDHPTSPGSC